MGAEVVRQPLATREGAGRTLDQRKQAMRALRDAMAGRSPDSSPAVSA